MDVEVGFIYTAAGAGAFVFRSFFLEKKPIH
jgi:hypothetical protein